MAIYSGTTDPDIINKIYVAQINIEDLVDRYLNLKSQYLVLPEIKTVPDEEALEIYNRWAEEQRMDVNIDIINIYEKIKQIKDAGLLPVKYDDEFQQLENYVNNL